MATNNRNWTLTLISVAVGFVILWMVSKAIWFVWPILSWWWNSPHWFEYGATAILGWCAVSWLYRATTNRPFKTSEHETRERL